MSVRAPTCVVWLVGLSLALMAGCREENPEFGESVDSSTTDETTSSSTSTSTSSSTTSTTDASTTTSDTTTSTSTTTDGTGTGAGTDTGGAVDCSQFDSPPACNGAAGCAWSAGMCLSSDPQDCPTFDQGQCDAAEQCTYDADAMTCQAA